MKKDGAGNLFARAIMRPLADALAKSAGFIYGSHSFGAVPSLGGFRPSEHVINAFHENAIVHACIKRIAQDVASVPLLFLKDPDDETSSVPDTDSLAKLFEKPNGLFTTRRLIEHTVMMRMLRGECIWLVESQGAYPSAILPWFDPRWWRETVSRGEGIVRWSYDHGDQTIRALPGEVMWTGNPNPTNPYRGLSPLVAVAPTIAIDNIADALQGDLLSRGGERGMLLRSEMALKPDQRDQVIAALARRRPGDGTAPRDTILPYGITPLPNEMARADVTGYLHYRELAEVAKRKICHVFGMAPILIGDDDSAQYASAPHAIKMYYRQTLVPLIHSLEDAFDTFFTERRGMRTFIRFDLSTVEALREDERQLAETARVHISMGIPLSLVNDRVGLGYNQEDMQRVDEDKASADERRMTMFLAEPNEPEKKATMLPDQFTISSRFADPKARIQRNRMLTNLTAKTITQLGKLSDEFGKRIASTLAGSGTVTPEQADAITNKIRAEIEEDMGLAVVETMQPVQLQAAEIGAVSIQDLVTGKAHEPYHLRKVAVDMSPLVMEAFELHRAMLLRSVGYIMDDVVTYAVDQIREMGETGVPAGKLSKDIRERFTNVTRARARVIARTEVGTMYNTGRYGEMETQGFEKHEWRTALDEATRESHADVNGEEARVSSEFSNGLKYPQESGAPAEEVINCRCETLPVV